LPERVGEDVCQHHAQFPDFAHLFADERNYEAEIAARVDAAHGGAVDLGDRRGRDGRGSLRTKRALHPATFCQPEHKECRAETHSPTIQVGLSESSETILWKRFERRRYPFAFAFP
jgi:hypothetical protein